MRTLVVRGAQGRSERLPPPHSTLWLTGCTLHSTFFIFLVVVLYHVVAQAHEP